MSLDALLKIADALTTPLLAALTFFVYRIYSNHLPHLEAELHRIAENIGERVSRLEGRCGSLHKDSGDVMRLD